jgi:phage terminase large subunit
MEVTATMNFRVLWNEPMARVNLFRGGARSSKTTSIMQALYLWLMSGKFGALKIPKGSVSVIRATFPALRATVLKEFEYYIQAQGVYHLIDHSKTTYTFKYRGREICFFSADDAEKLKGRQHTIIWFNEADSCQFDHFYQGLMRTEHFAILDYNPSNSDSWVKTELEEKRAENRKDVKVTVSTIYDNPFLPDGIIDEIEGLKDIDDELYKVYTLGQWAKLTGKIYPNYEIVDDFPFEPEKMYYGLDFGWTDPTAFITVFQSGNNLCLKQNIYQRNLTVKDLASEIKMIDRFAKVAPDPSSPERIYELRKAGIRCKDVKKGKDSILQGIQLMRQHNIYIDSGSVDLIKELKSYKWIKDSDGNETNKPIDYNNHLLDAARYAVTTFGRKSVFRLVGTY